jgi:hypothetical protein
MLRVSIPDHTGFEEPLVALVRKPLEYADVSFLYDPPAIERFGVEPCPHDHSVHAYFPFRQAHAVGQALPQENLPMAV